MITAAGVILAGLVIKAPLASVAVSENRMRALMTTDGTATTCPDEEEACLAESACVSCLETIGERGNVCQGSDYDSETSTCSEDAEVTCCSFEESPECVSDEVLGVFLGGC